MKKTTKKKAAKKTASKKAYTNNSNTLSHIRTQGDRGKKNKKGRK